MDEEEASILFSRDISHFEQSNKTLLCLSFLVGCIFIALVAAVPYYTPVHVVFTCNRYNQEIEKHIVYDHNNNSVSWFTEGKSHLKAFEITSEYIDLQNCRIDVVSDWRIVHVTQCLNSTATSCFICLNDVTISLSNNLSLYLYIRCDASDFRWPIRLKSDQFLSSPIFYVQNDEYMSFSDANVSDTRRYVIFNN